MKEKITVTVGVETNINDLVEKGFLTYNDNVYKLTPQAKSFIAEKGKKNKEFCIKKK